jgi:glycosyltransferase involved in cell wall biosynthesis
MNILHISAHLGDGAGKAITGLSACDPGNIYNCYLLDPPQKMKWVDYAAAHNIGVFWGDKAKFEELWKNADVIVFNWWECRATLEFLPYWQACSAKRKIIWSHQNGVYPPFPDNLISSTDVFLATTPLTIEKYPQIGTIENNLVYGFGDFSVDNFVPKSSYEIGETLNIVYVGLCSYKRFPDNVIDYFKAIIEKIPNAIITMFGEVSDDFRRDCETSEIAEILVLKGWTSDVISQIRDFDIGIFITKDEIYTTTENSIIEAMASGLPVVISYNEPYKYLLENGVSGLFARSPEQFADRIYALYTDEVLRRNLGTESRKYCENKYSSKHNLEVFLRGCGG